MSRKRTSWEGSALLETIGVLEHRLGAAVERIIGSGHGSVSGPGGGGEDEAARLAAVLAQRAAFRRDVEALAQAARQALLVSVPSVPAASKSTLSPAPPPAATHGQLHPAGLAGSVPGRLLGKLAALGGKPTASPAGSAAAATPASSTSVSSPAAATSEIEALQRTMRRLDLTHQAEKERLVGIIDKLSTSDSFSLHAAAGPRGRGPARTRDQRIQCSLLVRPTRDAAVQATADEEEDTLRARRLEAYHKAMRILAQQSAAVSCRVEAIVQRRQELRADQRLAAIQADLEDLVARARPGALGTDAASSPRVQLASPRPPPRQAAGEAVPRLDVALLLDRVGAATSRMEQHLLTVMSPEFADQIAAAAVEPLNPAGAGADQLTDEIDPEELFGGVHAWGAITSELSRLSERLQLVGAELESEKRLRAELQLRLQDRSGLEAGAPSGAPPHHDHPSSLSPVTGDPGNVSDSLLLLPIAEDGDGVDDLADRGSLLSMSRTAVALAEVAGSESRPISEILLSEPEQIDAAFEALRGLHVDAEERDFVADILDLRSRMARTSFKYLNMTLGKELSFPELLQLSNSNLDAICWRASKLRLRSRDVPVPSDLSGPEAMEALIRAIGTRVTCARLLAEQLVRLVVENAALRKINNGYFEIATQQARDKEERFKAQFHRSAERALFFTP